MNLVTFINGINSKSIDVLPAIEALNQGHLTVRIDANDGTVQKIAIVDMKLISK